MIARIGGGGDVRGDLYLRLDEIQVKVEIVGNDLNSQVYCRPQNCYGFNLFLNCHFVSHS